MKRKVSRISHITTEDFYNEFKDAFKLTLLREDVDMMKEIKQPATNRSGLALSGFLENFTNERVQILGNAEMAYIKTLDKEVLAERIKNICELNIPCFIISNGATAPDHLIQLIQQYRVPILCSPIITMTLTNNIAHSLEKTFALQTSAHGCMLNFRGIGVLIKGKSGSGKSETAIGLVERGGALVADDHVKIRNSSVINVANIYGLGSIQPDSKLDIIVNLKPYTDLNEVDRVGINRKTEDILGVDIPYVDIPVAPGRDTARLVAVTILELQLRRLGYDMADEFNTRLNERIAKNSPGINPL